MCKKLYYYEQMTSGTNTVEWGITTEVKEDYSNVRLATYKELISWSAAVEPIQDIVKVREGIYQFYDEPIFNEEWQEWDRECGYRPVNVED